VSKFCYAFNIYHIENTVKAECLARWGDPFKGKCIGDGRRREADAKFLLQ